MSQKSFIRRNILFFHLHQNQINVTISQSSFFNNFKISFSFFLSIIIFLQIKGMFLATWQNSLFRLKFKTITRSYNGYRRLVFDLEVHASEIVVFSFSWRSWVSFPVECCNLIPFKLQLT